METKIIFELPYSEYAAIPALSNSRLNAFRKSCAYYKYVMETATDRDTPTLRVGRALHCLALQPDMFNSEFYKLPRLDLRKAQDKELLKDLERLNAGKTALKEDEWEKVFAIGQALAMHSDASLMLKNTAREVSITFATNYVPCKARLDAWHIAEGRIVDIKTTDCSSPTSFAKSLYNYGYYRQAAWYLRGLKAQGADATSFYFIAVENAPPYQVCVYKVEPGIIELANQEINLLLEKYKRCTEENRWPSYTTGIRTIGLPAWAIDEVSNYLEGE